MTKWLSNARVALEAQIDQQVAISDWVQVSQTLIDQFADVSGDHQWIHVDETRAKDSPYGTTIAHGNLTLSMMGHLPIIEETLPKTFEGQKMGLNYGYDRVRFPNPVRTGSRIRSRSVLKSVETKGDMLEIKIEVTAEIEGETKPACVAERLRRLVF